MGNKKNTTHLLYSVILLLFFTTQIYAQPGWFQQNVNSSSSEVVNLIRVQYLDENNIIAISHGIGLVKKSTDGGTSWTNKITNTGILWGLHFVNPQVGYISGANGKILKSIDGGETWSNLSSGVNSRLWSVFFKDENIGFVTGENGLILKTTNGGINWTQSSIQGALALRKIIFTSNTEGFIASHSGIYKTTNSGMTWNLIYNIDRGMVDIEYRNDKLVAVGNGVIAASSNNGSSWITTYPSSQIFHGVAFITDTKVIATAYQSTIAISYNGGMTWSTSTNNYSNLLLTCPAFFNESKGILVGGDGYIESSNRGIILKTDDGAQSWQTILANYSQANTSLDFSSVYLVSENNVWLSTNEGFLYNSLDGGDNWELKFNTSFGINKVRFFNENLGIFACNSGRIGISTNGGANWSIITTANTSSYFDITFKSENEFYLCGNDGSIIKTTNAGSSFVYTTLGSSNSFRTIDTKNELVIVAGTNGKIFKSVDNGISWTTLGTNFTNHIYDLKILDENTYTVCGSSGMIRKSTNSGVSWVIQSAGISNHFNTMHYVNENVGYVAGNNGIILKTENQGGLWHIQNSTTSKNIRDVYFFNELIGNAAGDLNLILRTDDGGTISINPVSSVLPTEFNLSQNYPNPFNPSTKIRFSLPQNEFINLEVFDLQGRLVQNLVSEQLSAGVYEFTFNATDIASGVYFYSLTAKSFKETKRMLLVK